MTGYCLPMNLYKHQIYLKENNTQNNRFIHDQVFGLTLS